MFKKIITFYKEKILYKKFMQQWKRTNSHNSLNPLHIFPIEIVTAGKSSYGDIKLMFWNPNIEKLTIGNYVLIASNVTFILGGNHHTETLMTFPTCRIGSGGQGSYTKGEIKIEDDVWIGYGSTILSGVTIGQGAVIGACSVVGKNIPPYAIAVGNPIQIVKFRFAQDIINKLIKLDYSNLDEIKAKQHIDKLNRPLNSFSNIEEYNNLFTTT